MRNQAIFKGLLLAIWICNHAMAQTREESLSAFDREDYQKAFQGFSSLSESGDAISQSFLALMYEGGLGTKKNESAAFYWNYQSAEQGHWVAQLSIGDAYQFEKGIAKDGRKANFWWRLSCQDKHARLKIPEKCSFLDALSVFAEDGSIEEEIKNWRPKTPAQAKSLAMEFASSGKGSLVDITKNHTTKSTHIEIGSEVFAKVAPSVFMIRKGAGKGALQGSGVAYRYGYGQDYKPAHTWIATNAHVVAGSTSVTVESSGRTFTAKVKYADADLDLALIVVEGEVLPLAKISNAAKLVIGSKVFAIGSPYGLENTISEGLVSGTREFQNIKTIQTSAAISSGNSGGGLFDTEGKLLGITTFKFKGGENLNFAIDASYIEIIDDALLASGLIRASYDRKISQPGDDNDLDERYIESPNLTRWLLERVAPDGTAMHVYVNRLFNESIKKGKILTNGDKNFDQILQDYLKGRPKEYTAKITQLTDSMLTATYKLVCPMRASRDGSFQFDLNILVDVENSKVNGRQAKFTDSEIIFMTGKDLKFTAVVNRYSTRASISSVDVPSLLTGACTKLTDRQF